MQADSSRRDRFEALFERHHAPLAAYLRRRAPPAEVEDLLADTFLVAWRSLERVPDDALPWLYGVARRVLANERRGTARSRALAARLRREPRPAQRATLPVEVSEPVRSALLALPEREREAVLLIAWEELTPAQAAAALGCSATAFRVRLHRARGRLVRSLAPQRDPIAEVRQP
jgi:RNA polymerase sigma factor (sigma-70 family)